MPTATIAVSVSLLAFGATAARPTTPAVRCGRDGDPGTSRVPGSSRHLAGRIDRVQLIRQEADEECSADGGGCNELPHE